MIRPSVLGLALAFTALGAAAQQPGGRIAFVGCPIMRNTEPVPCWLGEYKGELYYLGSQGDLQAAFYPPQFNHRMLVEGTVTGERFCGGVVLKDAHASVLPDIDVTCNIMLPAQGYAEHKDVRGSGPSGVRGQPAEEPRAAPRPGPAVEAPKPPFAARIFTATFDADTERLWRPAQAAVNEAARYAAAAKAKRIEVVGHRAAIRLADGKDYVERPTVAADRAKAVAEALRTLGLPSGARLDVRWIDAPSKSTGTPKDAEARNVTITVTP